MRESSFPQSHEICSHLSLTLLDIDVFPFPKVAATNGPMPL
jgi:hypothetical protein